MKSTQILQNGKDFDDLEPNKTRMKYRIFNKKRQIIDTLTNDLKEPEKRIIYKDKTYKLKNFYDNSMDAVFIEDN